VSIQNDSMKKRTHSSGDPTIIRVLSPRRGFRPDAHQTCTPFRQPVKSSLISLRRVFASFYFRSATVRLLTSSSIFRPCLGEAQIPNPPFADRAPVFSSYHPCLCQGLFGRRNFSFRQGEFRALHVIIEQTHDLSRVTVSPSFT